MATESYYRNPAKKTSSVNSSYMMDKAATLDNLEKLYGSCNNTSQMTMPSLYTSQDEADIPWAKSINYMDPGTDFSLQDWPSMNNLLLASGILFVFTYFQFTYIF
jgi:hypothetical protein